MIRVILQFILLYFSFLSFYLFFLFLYLCLTSNLHVAEYDLKFLILLLPTLRFWDYRHVFHFVLGLEFRTFWMLASTLVHCTPTELCSKPLPLLSSQNKTALSITKPRFTAGEIAQLYHLHADPKATVCQLLPSCVTVYILTSLGLNVVRTSERSVPLNIFLE